jgi:hypothetical protein
MRIIRITGATLLMGGFTLTLAFPALAHEPKRHNHGATSEKHHDDHRERTKVRVRAPHTTVDVDTKRRRVHIRVPYYNRVIRW